MKRSEINRIMKSSMRFLDRMRFRLPPFAFWTPSDWRQKGPECREIVDHQLGWDITDFGRGKFARFGLFLFTIRNGTLPAARRGGKNYAEKVMIVQEGQITPNHFHFHKMEDIINRGGGDLVIQLWNSTKDEALARSVVRVSVDGVVRTVKAGGQVVLKPGESICLPQRLYHAFWGRKGSGTVLIGEVSMVNDDHCDNRFHEPIGRFAAIEEDVRPLHLLCNEYTKWYQV